jgi:hypothetical protein
MRYLRERLTYANVTATLALFLALGGASYAAVHVGKGSVGTEQLHNEAVSAAKIRDGAIIEAKIAEGAIGSSKLANGTVTESKLANGSVTESKLANGSVTNAKIADGAVSGAKVETSTLGTVPNADHAYEAAKAARSEVSKEAEFLQGRSPTDFGPIFTAHTVIPATTEDAEWWVPISGMGQVRHNEEEVTLLIPGAEDFSAYEFRTNSSSGLGLEAKARIYAQLVEYGRPVGEPISPTPNGIIEWRDTREISLWGDLAIHVIEKANGEEIPEFPLETALRLLAVK